MHCIIFVTVRTASTRLPRKALLKIKNTSLIKILVDRIRTSKHGKKVVVCTTVLKSDDVLSEFLQKNGIEVFRGSNVDVLGRLASAAKKYKTKQFIVVEGDDVFCDPLLIDQTCEKLSQTDYEFLSWENVPFGVSPVGIKTNKLYILVKNKDTKNTETGWGNFIVKSGIFKIGRLEPNNSKLRRPEIRLSIDYKDDLKLAKKIYENLHEPFSLLDIIKILDKNPEWLKINESLKKKYKQNFTKKMAKVIMKKRSQK